MNIAKYLASIGHKTLLLDCDLKRGTQHKINNINKIKKDDFILIDNKNIENYKLEDNYYVIPKLHHF